MALRNLKRFGLDVNANFSDVLDKNISLQALNLPPLDLDIIRGSADLGATKRDFRSFSRLEFPIWKELSRIFSDSQLYSSIINSKAGTDETLFGNLSINGSINGSSIRYRYIDFEDNNRIRVADISTSRSSSWSSSDTRSNNTNLDVQKRADILFGARVGIVTGGKLEFGTQNPTETINSVLMPAVTGPRLNTTINALEKEFKSEIPTHKIEVNINGSTVQIFAMKGIPLIFEGIFRNLDAEAQINQISAGGELISASWKIVESNNLEKYSVFEDQGGSTSEISFRSSASKRRFIQFYYSPDNITFLKINSASISEFPITILSILKTLDFSFNNITDLPNFTTIAPVLESFNMQRCPLHQSSIVTERKLQNSSFSGGTTTGTVLDKLPTTIRSLSLRENFYGSITQNIIADRFTGLVTLNLSRTRGGSGSSIPLFHTDSNDPNCELPNVSDTCKTYLVENNNFSRIGIGTTSGRRGIDNMPNLKTLSLSGNSNLPNVSSQEDIDFSNSPDLESLNLNFTKFKIPLGLANNSNLKTVSFTHGDNAGELFDSSGNYKFDNCSELTELNLSFSALNNSRFPVFSNEKLSIINLNETDVKGGKYDGATEEEKDEFVIRNETFSSAPELTNLTIKSGQLLKDKPIQQSSFINNTKLKSLVYTSFGRTNGILPSFDANGELNNLDMTGNNFTGPIPNFVSNPNIRIIRLPYNKLSGPIPSLTNLNKLINVIINNNELTSLPSIGNLIQLKNFYAFNNKLSGQIPDFSDCPNLKNLILYNNLFTDYTTGSFSKSYLIRYIDLSNCNLSQQAISQIVLDLLSNYNSANREGVVVNLRGNTVPSPLTLENISTLKSKGWNITHD